MSEKTIKLSEIKKLDVKEGEVLLVLQKPYIDHTVVQMLSEKLKCMVVFVDSLDDFMVVSAKKTKPETIKELRERTLKRDMDEIHSDMDKQLFKK